MNYVYRLYRLLSIVSLSGILAFSCNAAKICKNNGTGTAVKFNKNKTKIQKPKHKNKKKTRNVITKKRFLRIQGIRDNIKKLSTTNSFSTTDQDYTKTLNTIKESLVSLTKDFNTLTIPEEKTIIKNILNGFKKPFDTVCKTLNEKQNKKIADKVSNIVSYIFHQLQKLNTQVENDESLDKQTLEDLKNALNSLATDTMIQSVANTLEDKKLQEDMLRSVGAIDKCKKLLTIIVEKEPKEQKTFWTGSVGKVVLVTSVIFSLIGSVGQHLQEKPQPRLCFLPTQCKDSLGEFRKPVYQTSFNVENTTTTATTIIPQKNPQAPEQAKTTFLGELFMLMVAATDVGE